MGKYKDLILMHEFDEDDDAVLNGLLPYLPQGNDSFATEYCGDFGPPEYTCRHEPIDVGFTHSKWVCKKCDIELTLYQPENEKQ